MSMWRRIGSIRGPAGRDGETITGPPGEKGIPGDSVIGPSGKAGKPGRDGAGVQTAVAETLPPGSNASAHFDPQTGELRLGIPEGKQGRPGQTGYRGGTTRGLASGMVVKDEGSALNNGALVGSLNFTGSGVAASMVGSTATVNVTGGGGGGVSVLPNPGVGWQANHVYSIGDRFAETVDGELRVFEITVAGTSGSGSYTDYGADLVPLADWGTGTEGYIYIGIVGQLAWTDAPFLGGGLAVGPYAGHGHPLSYTTASAAGDSASLFALQSTESGGPAAVLELNSDGDGDHFMDENTGAGLRWHAAADGVQTAQIAEVTYQHFKTFSTVLMSGLPTSDPGITGQLYTDGVPSAGTPKTLKVSGG